MAAAIGAGLPVGEPTGSLIVDIGGGTTEVAVISLGGIVVSRSIRIGGDEIDQDIIAYARREYNLLLGERTAEDIKIAIGSAYPGDYDEQRVTLRGRDLLTGLPRAVEITADQVREAIEPSVQQIVDTIKDTIEETPPELVADIMDQGIVLAGGGALLQGLDRRVSEATQMPVHVADDPLSCGHGAVGDDVAVGQQALDFLLAPAAPERGGMQRGDRRGVAARRFRQHPARRARTNWRTGPSSARQLRGVLRLGVGRAQVKRLRRHAGLDRGGAEPGHPIDVGRAARIDQARRAFAGRPGRRQHRRRGAHQARRAGRRRAQRLAQGSEPRRHDGAAAGSEHLQVDVIVARIDDRDHRQRVIGGDKGRGIGSERGQADRRFAGGERDPARGGDADAQAGEAAGPGGHGDAVERGEFEPGALHHPCDQRHQRFRVAAHHRQRLMHGRRRLLGVEHGSRTGLERGIDGKDAHESDYSRVVAAIALTLSHKGRGQRKRALR